jgi:cell division septum initiation protein DivIVA
MTKSDAAHAGDDAVTPEELREDIERTREQLGGTVEALVAKADVKSRVQEKATETVGHAQQKAAEAVGHAQQKAAEAVGHAQQKAAEMAGQAREQARQLASRLPSPAADRLSGGQGGPGTRAVGLTVAACAALAVTWLLIRRARRAG